MSEKPFIKPEYLNPFKALPSAFSALKEAFKIKNESFWKRIGVFWDSFTKEMDKLRSEKEEVSREANELIKKETSQVSQIIEDGINYNKKVEDPDREYFKTEVIDPVLKNLGSDLFTEEQRGYVIDGLNKFKMASQGETPTRITEEQLSPTLAFAVLNLRTLKEKYPDPAKLKIELDKMLAISDKTDYPLKKLLSDRNVLLKVLGIKNFSARDLWNIKDLGFSLLSKFGLGTEVLRFVNPLLSEDEKGSLYDVLGQKLFPHTLESFKNKDNEEVFGKLFENLYNIASGKTNMNTKILSEIITIIDFRDYDELINKLLS